MNLTELARILRITPQELKDALPEMGFDIGQKAIKVDNRTAQTIIKEWAKYKRSMEIQKKEESKEVSGEKIPVEKKIITLSKYTTVKEMAEIAQIPVSKILAELMRNGIFTSMNEKIDYDTAAVIGADLNLDVQLKDETEATKEKSNNRLREVLEEENEKDLEKRPPVIVVMGHVDHGKTKLLDAIRKTNVVAGESGGITQHIGAYQVERKGKLITFIDTPGHEAFTAMRSRGAKVADVAILVVAADDGVKPQTIEAFRIIQAAKIPYIVAINKIDKESANIEKTKQELSSQLNILSEDWGGKISCVPVSALKGTGIEDVLDMILLVAEMEEDQNKANPNADAVGTVIESNIDKGAGPVATILVQNGTLKVGNQLTFAGNIYGRVRALKNYLGETIKQASPSTPVQILGLKILPDVGDVLEVGEGEKIKMRKVKTASRPMSNNNENDESVKKFDLIIKSDFFGSAEANEESLAKISTAEVKANIIHKGLGNVTEGDIEKAEGANAEILGFHVKIPAQIENIIREKKITVKTFDIIYDLLDYAKEKMQELAGYVLERKELGKLKVAAIFRTEKNKQIIGGKVLEGKMEINGLVEVLRNKELVTTGKIIKLQEGKQDVNEVDIDKECGIQFEGNPKIEAGDVLKVYKEELIKKNL